MTFDPVIGLSPRAITWSLMLMTVAVAMATEVIVTEGVGSNLNLPEVFDVDRKISRLLMDGELVVKKASMNDSKISIRHQHQQQQPDILNANNTTRKRKRSTGANRTRKGPIKKSIQSSEEIISRQQSDPFTFTNITVKRKIANNTELNYFIFFIWPSSSIDPDWFTSRSLTPSLSNFSIDIHIAKEGCLSRELKCSLIPETIYFKVNVPLDEWVRLTVDQNFFIYNTRYFVQLHNNNISRRSESKTFNSPSCRNPSPNFRTCMDTQSDLTTVKQKGVGLMPRIVCLAMDEAALNNHEIKFRIDWEIKKGQILKIIDIEAVGMEKVEAFLTAQSSGQANNHVMVYSRNVALRAFVVKTTRMDIDMAADDEFVVEITTKFEDWTVVHDILKVKTKIERLKKKLAEGKLKFCPSRDALAPVASADPLRNFIIIIAVIILFLIISITTCVIFGLKKYKSTTLNKTGMSNTNANSYKSSSINLLRESVSTCGSYTDEWEIEASDLELGKEVGQGAFGKVVYGLYKKQKVAVKVLKDNIHNLYREDLLREIALLKSVGTHQSIVSILGASTLKEPLALVMEYMPYGNLFNFLRRCRSNFDWRHESKELVSIQCMNDETSGEKEVWEITSKDLISWARQVAVAMEYLASKQYVHRDLAARNILLGTNKSIKLCDFGLARLIYRGDGHYFRKTNTKLPIKWMALESIRDRVYTSRSDVWSFGILLWEIATFGSCPYPTISLEDLPRYLEEGYRMPQPNNCSDELYLMMMDCWRSNPEDRPTFNEIRIQLEDMLSRDVDYLDLDVGSGESPFSVNKMPNNNDNNNNNNRNNNSCDKNNESILKINNINNNINNNNNINAMETNANQIKNPGKIERQNGIRSTTVSPIKALKTNNDQKESVSGKTQTKEDRNLSLPHLVKSKEIAIDKALVKSAAGKIFGGRIADNAFYHKSIIHDPKSKKILETIDHRLPNSIDDSDSVFHDLPHHVQKTMLPSRHPQLAINPDIVSESFPLLQLSPPPSSPLHSNFRLLNSSTDQVEFESIGSSDRSPSADTEDTRSSWVLDII